MGFQDGRKLGKGKMGLYFDKDDKIKGVGSPAFLHLSEQLNASRLENRDLQIEGHVWKNLSYTLVGEDLTKDGRLRSTINGITISPKKNFCIIKIWLASCDFQNPTSITNIDGITSHGCLFKKHMPEY